MNNLRRLKTPSKTVILVKESLLAFVNNSIGTKAYRNLYGFHGGKHVDFLGDGDNSCAYFVSSTLRAFKLVRTQHATVSGTVRAMEKKGWYRVDRPKIGDIIVWGAALDHNQVVHRHIGFYTGRGRAVSTHPIKGKVVSHHWTFGGKHGVEAIFRSPKLEKEARWLERVDPGLQP